MSSDGGKNQEDRLDSEIITLNIQVPSSLSAAQLGFVKVKLKGQWNNLFLWLQSYVTFYFDS